MELKEAKEILNSKGYLLEDITPRFERQYYKNDTVIILRKKNDFWGDEIDRIIVPTKGLDGKESFDLINNYCYKIVDKNRELIEESPNEYFLDLPTGRRNPKDYL